MKRIDRDGASASATFDFPRPSRTDAGDLYDGPAPHFAEADFLGLFESSAESLIIIDVIGVIKNANAPARELLGIKDGVHLRAELEDVLHGCSPRDLQNLYNLPTSAKDCPTLDATLVNGGRVRATRRAVLQRSGRLVLCLEELQVSLPVDAVHEIPANVLQTEKMAALGRFVSGVAHELNNPLTSIMGYAQLLLSRGLPQPQHIEANQVYQEAERARRIVKNLLYFARENRPERTRVNLNEIVERTLALRSYELKIENISVACDLAAQLPHTMADPYQLQQVVLNLLLNAEQAMLEQRGQGSVWIRTHHFSRRGEDHLLIEFSDDGPGIPSDIASRIFDPFFTTKPPGVGTDSAFPSFTESSSSTAEKSRLRAIPAWARSSLSICR